MPATERFLVQDTLGDESRYEMVAYDVPASNDFPEGIKYSFQYMAADGTTLLRYDNYDPNRPEGRHHRHHYREGVTSLTFEGMDALRDDFRKEVYEIHDERN